MSSPNGIVARLDYLERELDRLRDSRASKEAVKNVEDDVKRIEDSIKGLQGAFRNLQISILTGCVVWAIGSAGFIIGVLTLGQN